MNSAPLARPATWLVLCLALPACGEAPVPRAAGLVAPGRAAQGLGYEGDHLPYLSDLAHEAGLQVALGELASARGTTPSVRALGGALATAGTTLLAELRQLSDDELVGHQAGAPSWRDNVHLGRLRTAEADADWDARLLRLARISIWTAMAVAEDGAERLADPALHAHAGLALQRLEALEATLKAALPADAD